MDDLENSSNIFGISHDNEIAINQSFSLDGLNGNFEIDDILDRYNKRPIYVKEVRTPYPRLFSFRVLKLAFLTFGASGLLFTYFSVTESKTFLCALIFGLITCVLFFLSMKIIANQTIYNITEPIYINRIGTVLLTIPANGYGQIKIYVVNELIILTAKGENGVAIKDGSQVIIIKKSGNICIVRPI